MSEDSNINENAEVNKPVEPPQLPPPPPPEPEEFEVNVLIKSLNSDLGD